MRAAKTGPNVTGVTVASVVFPGLGQLINGDIGKGVAMMAAYIVLWYIAWPLALILCAGSGMDAYTRAIDLNEDLHNDEKMKAEAFQSQITAESFVAQIDKIAKLAASGILDEGELTERKRKVIVELSQKTLVGSSEDFLTALIPLMKNDALSKDELSQIKSLVPS